MRNCPVKNCPAKTRARIAFIAAGVMALVSVAVVLLHFLLPTAHGAAGSPFDWIDSGRLTHRSPASDAALAARPRRAVSALRRSRTVYGPLG